MPTMVATYQGQAVGANFQSLLPGFLIRGLSIDNPSGSWLFITSSNTYVPPYTLGYRATIKPAALQISVQYTNGPGGQVSSNVGSPASINLYSQSVIDSPGSAFLNPDGSAIGTAIPLTPRFVTFLSSTGVGARSVTFPAGTIAANDLIFVGYHSIANNGPYTITGFTQLVVDLTGGANDFLTTAYKRAVGGETTITVTPTIGGIQGILIVGIYRNLPYGTLGGQASAVNAAAPVPNPIITPLVTPDIWAAMCGSGNNVGDSITNPGNTTIRARVPGVGGSAQVLELVDATFSAAVAQDPLVAATWANAIPHSTSALAYG